MGQVVVLGESVRVRGYSLVGAVAIAAETSEEVRGHWATLGANVSLVILSAMAAEALKDVVGHAAHEPLTVEMAP